MSWNSEHKIQSRKNILEAAAYLFACSGFAAVSIDDVMDAAGLTRGTFYTHFSSKSELYNEAVLYWSERTAERIIGMISDKSFSFEDFVERYLSIGNNAEANGKFCLLAFLVTDICHQDEEVRNTYTKTLKGYQSVLQHFKLNESEAIQASILLVGGLALSRATNCEAMRTQILRSSYQGAMSLAHKKEREPEPESDPE